MKMCDFCQEFNLKTVSATSRCLDCRDNLCSDCSASHCKTKLTRSHRLVDLTELRNGSWVEEARDKQMVCCEEHDEALVQLCRNCNQLVCKHCKLTAHDRHSFGELKEARDTFTRKISPLLTRTQDKLDKLDNYSRFLEAYTSYVTNCERETHAQIVARAREMHEMIERYKDELLQRVTKASDDHRTQVTIQSGSGEV